jgi:uncharacterized membrane protein
MYFNKNGAYLVLIASIYLAPHAHPYLAITIGASFIFLAYILKD